MHVYRDWTEMAREGPGFGIMLIELGLLRYNNIILSSVQSIVTGLSELMCAMIN